MRISDWSSDVCSSDLSQGNQEVHPLYRRLAAQPAWSQADVHGGRASAAVACAAAERSGPRHFLRDPRHRIFNGRYAPHLERRLAPFRPPPAFKRCPPPPPTSPQPLLFRNIRPPP